MESLKKSYFYKCKFINYHLYLYKKGLLMGNNKSLIALGIIILIIGAGLGGYLL